MPLQIYLVLQSQTVVCIQIFVYGRPSWILMRRGSRALCPSSPPGPPGPPATALRYHSLMGGSYQASWKYIIHILVTYKYIVMQERKLEHTTIAIIMFTAPSSSIYSTNI